MGFTRKSWLAMVLAIVMVLGMAMPTALANPAPSKYNMVFKTNAAPVTDVTSAGIDMYLDSEAVRIDLFNDTANAVTTGFALDRAVLGQTPTIEIKDVDPAITVTAGDGFVTIAPKGDKLSTTTSPSFKISIMPASADGLWKDSTDTGLKALTTPDQGWEGGIDVRVKPILTGSLNAIALDKGDSTKRSVDIDFGSKPSDENLAVAAWDGNIYPNKDGTGTPLTPSNMITVVGTGNTRTVALNSGAAVATGYLKFTATVTGSVATKVLVVPISIADKGAVDVAYKVKSSVPSIKRRLSDTTSNTFKLSFLDAADKPVVYPTITAGNWVIASSNADVVAASAVSVGSDGTVTWAYANAKPEGKTTLTFNYPGYLPTTVDVEIEPLTMKPLGKINLFTNPASNAQTFAIAPEIGNVLDNGTITVTGVTVKPAGLVSTSLSSVGITGTPTKLGKGMLTIEATNNGKKVKPMEVEIEVIDNIQYPTLTYNTPADLDIAITTNPQQKITFKPAVAGQKVVSYNVVEENSAGYLSLSGNVNAGPASLDEFIVSLNPTTKVGTTNLVVDAVIQVDTTPTTLAVKQFKIPVNVKNTTTGAAVSIKTDWDSKEFTMSDLGAYLNVDVVDKDGKPVASSVTGTVTATIVSPRLQPTGVITVGTTSGSTSAGPLTGVALTGGQVFVKPALEGEAQIELTFPGIPKKVVNVKIAPVVVTPSASKITLDLADMTVAKTHEATVTFSSTFGVVELPAVTGISLKAGSTGSFGTNVKVNNNTFKFVGATKGSGTVVIAGATAGGKTAKNIEIPYEIVNTKGLKTNKDAFAFDLKSGGLVLDTLTVTSNPASFVSTTGFSVTSSDATMLQITTSSAFNGTTGTYGLKALKVGTGSITIKAKEAAAPNASLPNIIIPFTIVDGTGQGELVVTPSPVSLDINDATKKEVELTIKGKLATDVVTATDVKSNNPAVAIVSTTAPWKVTAVAKGTTTLTVKGNVNGNPAKDVTVTVNVVDSAAPKVAGMVLDGTTALGKTATIYLMGDGSADPLNVHSIVLNDANGNPVTGQVTWSTQYSSIIAVDKTNVATSKLTVKKTGTVTIKAKDVAANKTYSVKFTVKYAPATGITQISPFDMLVGERITLKPQLAPAGARVRGFTYSSNKKSVATVNTSGAVSAKGAGEAVITIRNKAKTSMKIQVTITVKNDPTLINYKAAYLMINENGKANAAEADLKAIFEAASYKAGNTSTAAKIDGTSKTTVLAGLAPFQGAASGIGAHDVFTFFYSGPATKTGLTIGAETLSYADLAAELAKINGNIVVMLDCTGGNRMINTKSAEDDAAINANIIGAFAKASVKSGMTSIGYAGGKTKFNVLTATKTKSQTSRIVAGSETATDMSKIFSKALVDCLKKTDGKMLADKDSNSYVTMSELYSKVKSLVYSASKKKMSVGVWPTTPTKMPVYASVNVAAPVTP